MAQTAPLASPRARRSRRRYCRWRWAV